MGEWLLWGLPERRYTLTFNGANCILKLLIYRYIWAPHFQLPTQWEMKWTDIKTTENWRERGEDRRAIGSHNVKKELISFIKVCAHLVCNPFVYQLGQDGIWPGKSLQKKRKKMMRGFNFAMKISESEEGNYSRQIHLSYIAWPLKHTSIT